MSTLSTGNYTIGMPDVYFCNKNVSNNIVTTTSAAADLAILLDGIAGTTAADTSTRGRYTLGNLPEASVTPGFTVLDHFISNKGARKKDKTVITEKNMAITLKFDEINFKNVTRFLMGDGSTEGAAVMEEVLAEGSAVMVFKTDIGQSFIYAIPRCSLTPEGDFPFSGEDWMGASIKLDVLDLAGFNPANLSLSDCSNPTTDGSHTIKLAPYGYIQTEHGFGATFQTTCK